MCWRRRRDKVAKALQSNPFQFALCCIILLDAAVVIAQILIDINAVKRTDYAHSPHNNISVFQRLMQTNKPITGLCVSFLRQLTQLVVAAERRPCSKRSISSTRRAHSSKPAARCCCGRQMGHGDGRTDGRTPCRYIDSASCVSNADLAWFSLIIATFF